MHGHDVVTDPLPTNPRERQALLETREAMRVPCSGKMLLSAMWVHRRELELFRAKPWALHIDFTANTNAEKRLPVVLFASSVLTPFPFLVLPLSRRPLFLACGLTAMNEVCCLFRCLTPNEQRKWTDAIVSFGLPRLVGPVMKSVRVGIGDQCGNEIVSWQKGFVKCFDSLTSSAFAPSLMSEAHLPPYSLLRRERGGLSRG